MSETSLVNYRQTVSRKSTVTDKYRLAREKLAALNDC
jgi:hypothetical protein